MTSTNRKLTPDARRQKIRRQRARFRIRCASVQYDERVTPEELVRAGLLDRQSIDDPRAVGDAFSVIVAEWVKKNRHA
jgi:hypothetical protein